MKRLFPLICILSLLLAACGKEDLTEGVYKCTIVSHTPTSITVAFTATLPDDVSDYHVGCIISTDEPMYESYSVLDFQPALPGTSDYTFRFGNLSGEIDYKIRAVVQKGDFDTVWGELLTFNLKRINVESSSKPIEEYEPVTDLSAYSFKPKAVDLGLSVMWADVNVGAAKPTDAGVYVSWGATMPQSFYSWMTYPWCDGSWDAITKYQDVQYYVNGDGLYVLLPEDDAATVLCGSSWRIPSSNEFQELLYSTRQTLETIDGHSCIVFSAPNGNSITMPLSGFILDDDCYYKEYIGFYHASEVRGRHTCSAVQLSRTNGAYLGSMLRYYGATIRPVTNE